VYADVVPDPGRPFDRSLTYLVPPQLEGEVCTGCQAIVPLGNRSVPAIVLRVHEKPPFKPLSEAQRPPSAVVCKSVQAVIEGAPALSSSDVSLACWISERYLSPIGACLRLFLPEGGAPRASSVVALKEEAVAEAPEGMPAAAAFVLRRLRDAGGEASAASLRRALGKSGPTPGRVGQRAGAQAVLSSALEWLRSRGMVETRAFVRPPAVKPRVVWVVESAREAGELEKEAEARQKHAAAQARVLRFVARGHEGMPVARLASGCGVSASAVSRLVREGLLVRRAMRVERLPGPYGEAEPAPRELTLHQGTALRAILEGLAGAKSAPAFLLYGVTASGKTEVIIQTVARVLASGKQAIVLVPEISLSAQAVSVFRSRFGDSVAVMHSGLSAGERYDEWHRVERGEAGVVVGARSAVFAPCRRLGLIVVDEEQDSSYKQEQPPRYNARDVAMKRGEVEGACVVLCSATPSLESFHAARQGRLKLLHLPVKADGRSLPRVSVVDLRGSAAHRTILTGRLTYALKRTLDRGRQAILFLNRRGFATALVCQECGREELCRNCHLALTFHEGRRPARIGPARPAILLCHHCGFAEAVPQKCSHCGGWRVAMQGFGTQRVEKAVQSLFPKARILRLDSDAVAHKDEHVRIVESFRKGRADILIGTQLVAKGFDFPRVAMVGVISPDVALSMPDFRCAERTFQLLEQVAGRCGRRKEPGSVFVQTYQPEHYALQAAAQHDYEGFFAQELETRRLHGFPPFSVLARLVFSAESGTEAREAAERAAEVVRNKCAESGAVAKPEGRHGIPAGLADVLGPAPAAQALLRGRHRWNLLVRAENHENLLPPLREAISKIKLPRSVEMVVDVDPQSLL
jgi:primosomal protein N' (replication factor Y)